MKLSTSSSLFFATLALSSSSSTLAAPARDATESGLSVSPSTHNLFDSAHPATHCSAHRTQPQPTPVEGSSGHVTARSISLQALVEGVPIIGPILASLLGQLSAGKILAETSGVSAQENQISAQEMAALQAAIDEVTRAVNNNNNTVVSKPPVPSPLTNVANGLPVVQSDFDPSGPAAAPGSVSAMAPTMSSAQASSTPSMAVNDVPSSSSKLPSAFPTPLPVVPVNLPTSSLPVRLPV